VTLERQEQLATREKSVRLANVAEMANQDQEEHSELEDHLAHPGHQDHVATMEFQEMTARPEIRAPRERPGRLASQDSPEHVVQWEPQGHQELTEIQDRKDSRATKDQEDVPVASDVLERPDRRVHQEIKEGVAPLVFRDHQVLPVFQDTPGQLVFLASRDQPDFQERTEEADRKVTKVHVAPTEDLVRPDDLAPMGLTV